MGSRKLARGFPQRKVYLPDVSTPPRRPPAALYGRRGRNTWQATQRRNTADGRQPPQMGETPLRRDAAADDRQHRFTHWRQSAKGRHNRSGYGYRRLEQQPDDVSKTSRYTLLRQLL